MPFQIVSPIIAPVDGDSFKEALKNFVKMRRDIDLTKIVIADQMNRQMKANIRYYLDNLGNRKANIHMTPLLEPTGNLTGMVGMTPYGMVPTIGAEAKLRGMVVPTNQGKLVVPTSANPLHTISPVASPMKVGLLKPQMPYGVNTPYGTVLTNAGVQKTKIVS